MSRLSFTLFGVLALLIACSRESIIDPPRIVGDTIPAPLSHEAGDAKQGKLVFVSRERGHCILCHTIEGLKAEFQGNLGPDLSDVGNRLTSGQLRLRIVDITFLNPNTAMPPYFRIHDLNQVENRYKMQTILSAQEIEDLVSYLIEQKF